MKRYYRRDAESDLGTGLVWLEFDGEMPTRQVEHYGARWFSSRDDYHLEIGPGLIDQPLSELELGAELEITPVEFEHAWEESGLACE